MLETQRSLRRNMSRAIMTTSQKYGTRPSCLSITNPSYWQIQYHPTYPNLLLSGSTDGLVNVYNTIITDEEDALYQVINHGSSIHHAGFLSDMDVFALSHDENLSMYRLADPDDDVKEPSPTVFGDLREPLRCQYVVDILRTSQGAMIGAGSYRYSQATMESSRTFLISIK